MITFIMFWMYLVLIGLHISGYPMEGTIPNIKVYMYIDIWYL